jgi:transposase
MDMQTRTQLTLAIDLSEQGLSHTKIAVHLGRHRETIGLWLQGLAIYGRSGFLDRHRPAKLGPRLARQVPATITRLIWALRAREYDCCGQKIAYVLEREYHVRLSVPKLYEILAAKYVIRSKWCKNQKRGAVSMASRARAVIQVALGRLFAFTGIDMYTKEADVVLRPALNSDDGAALLHTAMSQRVAGRGEVLQTDGGPEFKGACAQQAHAYGDRHRMARPYKKNEQANIESFNRTLRKECMGWGMYRADDLARLIPEVDTFLARDQYHRPHLGFSPMRPPLRTPITQEEKLSDIYGG